MEEEEEEEEEERLDNGRDGAEAEAGSAAEESDAGSAASKAAESEAVAEWAAAGGFQIVGFKLRQVLPKARLNGGGGGRVEAGGRGGWCGSPLSRTPPDASPRTLPPRPAALPARPRIAPCPVPAGFPADVGWGLGPGRGPRAGR